MNVERGGRRRLAFAAAAVLLAAADTYVVVLALPSIMGDVGVPLDALQRATPIVSGFLLGYIVMLPLLGRLSDVYGRRPVFAGCLIAFAAGSVITAGAESLPAVTLGRTVQGLGGGGLVPVTLAIVADLWPEGARGLPLGIVSAVQEFGSVLGPVYGAALITVSTWRTIFWVNVPLALVLGVGFMLTGGETAPIGLVGAPRAAPGPWPPQPRRRRDFAGGALVGIGVTAAMLAFLAPAAVTSSLAAGQLYQPLVGDSGATTGMALAAYAALALFIAWELAEARGVRPLIPLRRVPEVWHHADWIGALLLAAALGCVVLSFAAADPSRQVVADSAWYLLPLGAGLAVVFVVHEVRTADPLVAFPRFRDRAAAGSLITNLVLGAALMTALIDVPIFARGTAFPDSQLQAALVLVRLLAAVPVGALLGGFLCERLTYRGVTAAGMALSAAMFAAMTRWDEHALTAPGMLHTPVRQSDVVLALCGLGFGLAVAPVNAAMLAVTPSEVHGLASALVVVARMIGMLAGLSLLTAIGLRTFFQAQSGIKPPFVLCPHSPAACPPYDILVTHAIVEELHVIFAGAALCAGAAAVLGGALLRRGIAPAPEGVATHG